MDNINERLDNGNEKTGVTADAADAEKENAAAELGKFKSVDALISAYKSLEAEFTRRSQRLKELEEVSKAQENPAPSPQSGETERLIALALADEKVREAVIGEYLKTVSQNKSIPLIVGGVSTPAPKTSPKSVKEAGALARQYLKG